VAATTKISDVELFLVEVPMAGNPAPRRSLIVHLLTNTGGEGWGEGLFSAWQPTQIPDRREWLSTLVTGRSLFDLEELLALPPLANLPAIRCALEMACWDAIGHECGQPVCHLIGGVYRERVPLALRLYGPNPNFLPHQARRWADSGYYAQILPLSGRNKWDLQLVKSVRDSAGHRVRLRLDGGGRFSPEAAAEFCDRLEPHGIQFFLDPIEDPHFHRTAKLWRGTNVPLAVNSGIASPKDVMSLLQAGAVTRIIVGLDRVGGLLAAKQCAAVARAGGLDMVLDSGSPLGIATAAMLHVAASTPELTMAHESGYPLVEDDLLIEPLSVIDGTVAVPQGMGLGIEVDRDKVDGYVVPL
jgi:glucarate dehydratase